MTQGKRSKGMVKGAMAETVSKPRPFFNYAGLLQEWLGIIENGTDQDIDNLYIQFKYNNPFTPQDSQKIVEKVLQRRKR